MLNALRTTGKFYSLYSLYFETRVIKLRNLLKQNETGLVISQLVKDALRCNEGIGAYFNILVILS
jgi:hypothetical protein